MSKPIVRCSSLDQLLECPGSRTQLEELRRIRLAAGLPVDEDTSTAITWSGNWCHWEAARILIDLHGAICMAGLPEWPREVPRDFQPSGFDRWCVQYYVSTILDYVGPDMALEVEGRLEYDLGPCILTGHPDLTAISADGTKAVGADFKRGHNPVDPANCNWQVTGYQTLYKLAYPGLRSMAYLIVQPAVFEDDDTGIERVSTVLVEDAELEALPNFLAFRIADAFARPMDLNSGWRQCLYCDIGLQCEAVQLELEDMKLTLTKIALEAEPSNELLGRWKAGQKLLSKLMEQASDLLKQRTDAAGGSLVTSAISVAIAPHKSARVVQAEEGWNRLCDLAGEEPPEDLNALLYECMKLGAGDIESFLSARLGIPKESKAGKKKEKQYDAKDAFVEKFGDITTQEIGKKLVVTG